MDKLERAYYEEAFKRRFLELKGNAFQDFFADIMARGYPGDYSRTRPWGNVGDRKSDGYLKSCRILFQVYAPNEMTKHEAISKINEDFFGALPYWEEYFDTWVFAHNSTSGLGADVLKRLLQLDKEHPEIEITHWGFESLRIELFKLDESDIISLLGYGRAPSHLDMQNVRFDHLRIIIHSIAISSPNLEEEIRPVPPNKLSRNNLSDNIRVLLNEGMKKSKAVSDYFREYFGPTLSGSLATTFNERYLELRERGLSPDDIFHSLYLFAGGTYQQTQEGEAAVLAVLAYFFEKCDIFERPLEEYE